MRVDDGDIGSLEERTILASDGSYQILQGFETRVETPLSVKHITSRDFDTPKETEEEDGFFFREGTYHTAASAGGARVGNKRDKRPPATKVSVPTHGLYGPHGSGTGICGGIVARRAQGQFLDRFCLKN